MKTMFQWNRVLKIVRDSPNSSISLVNLADTLHTQIADPMFINTVEYLKKKRHLSICLGKRESGSIGLVATLTDSGLSEIPKDTEVRHRHLGIAEI